PQLSLEVFNRETNRSIYFNLGPHPPRLWPEDVDMLHQLWLELSERGPGHKLHHRDVIRVALRRLERDLRTERERDVLAEIQSESAVARPPSSDEPATGQTA
ncbi:MAG: APC family permease, partial [Acidobacteria bacterium]|nr:APC family permease [Acidobacteriota bacterium]